MGNILVLIPVEGIKACIELRYFQEFLFPSILFNYKSKALSGLVNVRSSHTDNISRIGIHAEQEIPAKHF